MKIHPTQICELNRDNQLAEISQQTLKKRYYWNAEKSPQEIFARVACYYSKDEAQAKRLYNYISNGWFIPSTPILSNGGTNKGFPVSCYLNEVQDTFQSIDDIFTENMYLAKEGGGIGTYWGNVRSAGEIISNRGQTAGIIPFLKVQDAMTTAVSQGSLRRGSTAAYLHVSHPEIMEFLSIRKNTGDPSRRCPQIHHGVIITDAFMNAVIEEKNWNLVDTEGITKHTVKAREIWFAILETRIETGEPYIIFIDTVNRAVPEYYKKLNKKVTTSNLCAEITLTTENRTGVCFLSSLNLAKYDDFKNDKYIIRDILEFLDAVVTDFINKTGDYARPEKFAKARASAIAERSIGLGVMGFHSLLQRRMIDIESTEAKELNIEIFRKLRAEANEISEELARKKSPCGDYFECVKKEEVKTLRLIIHHLHDRLNSFLQGDELTHKAQAELEEICRIHDIENTDYLVLISEHLYQMTHIKDQDEFLEAFARLTLYLPEKIQTKTRTISTLFLLREMGILRFKSAVEDEFLDGFVIKIESAYLNFLDYESIDPILQERFTHKLAIAPTASISLIAGGVSPGIDPFVENSMTVRTKNGATVVYNPELVSFLRTIEKNTDEVWAQIIRDGGSVRNLDFLNPHEKEVFKTAFEIDQHTLIELAADRTEFICQSQSLNLFIRPDESKEKINDFHVAGWAKGVKSFYYVRSKAMRKTEAIEACIDDVCEVCQ